MPLVQNQGFENIPAIILDEIRVSKKLGTIKRQTKMKLLLSVLRQEETYCLEYTQACQCMSSEVNNTLRVSISHNAQKGRH